MADDEGATDGVTDEAGFTRLLETLKDSYNFDFREYKASSLVRRTRVRMAQLHVDTFDAYTRYLETHPEEHVALFNAILINVTSFFRDAEAWAALDEHVIPRLVTEAAETRRIRVWSAGCASGEEPYSVAIRLAEHLGQRAAEFQIKIYGTDVDEDALAAARQALYRLDQVKDVPDRLLERYFMRDGQLWRLRRDIRRWCIFGAHNLTQAPPLSHIDLLVCRNALIYFNAALQDRILARFHYAIREGGYLFLGRSESQLTRSRTFVPLQPKWRIFQRVMAAPIAAAEITAVPAGRGEPTPAGVRAQRALDALSLAVIVVDPSDTVLTWNAAAEVLFEIPNVNAVGKKFHELDVSYRVEGLRARMEEVKTRQGSARLDGISFTRRAGEIVQANFVIAPLFDAYRFIGLAVTAENATEHARLKDDMTRIAEQHATAIEELQSTNEELETTNEELQSTNEELETTNEELQSTNEELETTIEELQAANAELAALNSELEDRGNELSRLDGYHRGVVNSVEEGLIVVDRDGVVRMWNHACERMWGLRAEHVVGRSLFALPLGEVNALLRPAFDRMVETGDLQQIAEVPYTAPGGHRHQAVVRVVPIKDGAGVLLGGVATAWPDEGKIR